MKFEKTKDKLCQFIFYYIPLYSVIFYTIYLYTWIYLYMNGKFNANCIEYRLTQNMLSSILIRLYFLAIGLEEWAKKHLQRVRYYPLILLFCNLPISILRFMVAAYDILGTTNSVNEIFISNWRELTCAAAATLNCQGLLNSMVFGGSEIVQHAFREW
jgi:hypothetical protein